MLLRPPPYPLNQPWKAGSRNPRLQTPELIPACSKSREPLTLTVPVESAVVFAGLCPQQCPRTNPPALLKGPLQLC